jgi:hypothetical protein
MGRPSFPPKKSSDVAEGGMPSAGDEVELVAKESVGSRDRQMHREGYDRDSQSPTHCQAWRASLLARDRALDQ